MSNDPAKKERLRIRRQLKRAGVTDERIKLLEPVIENVAWMRGRLDQTRDLIENSQVTIAYDNGGGQKGIRENPAYKGYEALWRSYMLGIAKILEALPAEIAKEEKKEAEKDAPKNVLALVQAKHA